MSTLVNQTQETGAKENSDETVAVALRISFTILIIINLFGNTMVCTIVWRVRKMRNPINYLICNLCVADILVAVFLVPVYVLDKTFTHPSGREGALFCKVLTGSLLVWVGAVASVFNLTAIAFERYFAVVHAHRSQRRMTSKKVLVVIISSWLFAIALNLPAFIVMDYDPTGGFCYEAWPAVSYGKGYTVFVTFPELIIPSTLMAYLYSRVVATIRTKEHIEVGQSSSTNNAITRRNRKVVQMVITVTVIFILCWIPNLVFYLMFYYSSLSSFLDVGYKISLLFLLLNSSVNPFIYALHSERYRAAFKDLLCLRLGRVGPTDSNDTELSPHPNQLGRSKNVAA